MAASNETGDRNGFNPTSKIKKSMETLEQSNNPQTNKHPSYLGVRLIAVLIVLVALIVLTALLWYRNKTSQPKASITQQTVGETHAKPETMQPKLPPKVPHNPIDVGAP